MQTLERLSAMACTVVVPAPFGLARLFDFSESFVCVEKGNKLMRQSRQL